MTLRIPLAIAAAAIAAIGASTASAGLAGVRTCHGLPVTVKASKGTVVGTPARDVIALTGRATVYAGRGDDVICGSASADTVYAGPGRDVVVARRGDDVVYGGPGADNLYGEQGRDHLIGGLGRDLLMGGSGSDSYRHPRGGRSAEHQTGGDIVVPGTRAVSLAIDEQSLMDLYESAQAVGFSWAPGVGQARLVSGIFQPLMQNSIAASSSYSAQVSVGSGMPLPGERFNPNTSAPVQLADLVTVDVAGGIAVGGRGPQDGVQILNQSQQLLVGGLSMNGSINGQPVPQSMAVQEIGPFQAASFGVPGSLSLFVGPEWQYQPSSVVGQLPQVNATVTFDAGTEVADVSYSGQAGFVQG